MSTVIKYIILIFIALLVGCNNSLDTKDDCSDGICPMPQEYIERGSNNESNK